MSFEHPFNHQGHPSMRFSWKVLPISLLLCSSTASLASQLHEVPPEVQSELMGHSTSDFTQHGPPVESVRGVHIRYNTLPSGEHSYMLCGQFRARSTESDSQWTDFATIKTDPYEQWIGSTAQAQCERATVASSQPRDLSALLQARLGSSRSE